MIGSRFRGIVEQINYFPQDPATNRGGGAWWRMEQEWATQVQANVEVEVDIKPQFNDNIRPRRPSWFEVQYKYGGIQQRVPQTPPPVVNTLPVPTNVVNSTTFIIPNP